MNVKCWLHASYSELSVRTSSSELTFRRALLLCAMLYTLQAFSADISGITKHATEPGWIEIRLEEGAGTVVLIGGLAEVLLLARSRSISKS